MQNSEAVQAWFQGKMASFRILGLVSKNEIRSREFSFSSRSLRVKIINLDLVSMPEIGGNFFSVSSRSLRVSVRNSRSRLDERDWIGETLILVSRLKKRLSLTTGLLLSPTPQIARTWSLQLASHPSNHLNIKKVSWDPHWWRKSVYHVFVIHVPSPLQNRGIARRWDHPKTIFWPDNPVKA